MKQLVLPLGPVAGAEAFVVGEANAKAVQLLDRPGTWPVMAAMITGPRKSGKSLLARTMAAKSSGTIADDAERMSETALFHAWNAAQAERRPLFIVADEAPPAWKVKLPDLRSRLAATPVARIDPPDDALLGQLLTRKFERHELFARPEVTTWLLRRLDRSYVALLRAVDALEEDASRRQNRRLSIPVARTVLGAAGLLVEPPPVDDSREGS